jgi:hypothetical protein
VRLGDFQGQEKKQMANHPNRAKQIERAVLVTTSHRGVFFGYASDTDGATIKLRSSWRFPSF